MNPLFCSSAAVTLSANSDDASVLALDEVLHEALRGSDSALHVAAYELRGRIIMDVWSILEPFGYEHAAEDIADDTLLAVLEGEVRARRGPGQALAAVMRKARKLTRHYLRERGKRWALDEE